MEKRGPKSRPYKCVVHEARLLTKETGLPYSVYYDGVRFLATARHLEVNLPDTFIVVFRTDEGRLL